MGRTQQVGMDRPHCLWYNNRGAILGTSMVLLAILTLLGSMAIMTAVTDNDIAGNLKTRMQTFNDAEAGVHYIVASIAPAIVADQLQLNGTQPSETYPVVAPTGFAFNPCNSPIVFTRVGGTRRYQFEVSSQATRHDGKSSTTLQVAIQREPLLLYGLFGDEGLNLVSSRWVYSYDSTQVTNPTPSNTGEADVATNRVFAVTNLAHIDGDVALGDDGQAPTTEGSISVNQPTGTLTVNGEEGKDIPRIDPDPWGAASGALATQFTAASTTNNNAFVGISANTIHLTTGQELTLTSGIYYLESVTMEPGSTLHIDTSAGDVHIFLTGPSEAQGGPAYVGESAITFNGKPTQFVLFSNATAPITFHHDGVFKGVIYAPFADVSMNNTGFPIANAYGLIWAKTITMNVDRIGRFYIDKAAQDLFLSNRVSLVSWREIRK